MSLNKNQLGFSLPEVIVAVFVIVAIIAVAYVVKGPPKSTPPTTSASDEQAALASNYPKSPVDLVEKVYSLELKSFHDSYNASPDYVISQVQQYLSPELYNSLKPNPMHGLFCIGNLPSNLSTKAGLSSSTTASVNLEETFDPKLPPPDPSVATINVMVSLKPLKITGINCPYFPIQAAG